MLNICRIFRQYSLVICLYVLKRRYHLRRIALLTGKSRRKTLMIFRTLSTLIIRHLQSLRMMVTTAVLRNQMIQQSPLLILLSP